MIRILHFASSRLTLKAKLLIGLAIAAAVSVATMLLLAVIGVALIIIPVMLVAGLVYGLLPGRRQAAAPQRTRDPTFWKDDIASWTARATPIR